MAPPAPRQLAAGNLVAVMSLQYINMARAGVSLVTMCFSCFGGVTPAEFAFYLAVAVVPGLLAYGYWRSAKRLYGLEKYVPLLLVTSFANLILAGFGTHWVLSIWWMSSPQRVFELVTLVASFLLSLYVSVWQILRSVWEEIEREA